MLWIQARHPQIFVKATHTLWVWLNGCKEKVIWSKDAELPDSRITDIPDRSNHDKDGRSATAKYLQRGAEKPVLWYE